MRSSSFIRALFLPIIFLGFFCVAFPGTALAVSCSATSSPQNGINVAPSQGGAFYVDTGNTPALTAGYVGYRVGNHTGSATTTLWAQLSNFTGGNISLANSADSIMELASTTNNSTSTAYFMLKATGATASAQTHTLKIYNGRPDLNGSAVVYQCDYTFSAVKETISASANKLADNGFASAAQAIDVSNSAPKLGELVTITVEGQTGQVGQGSAPDGDMIWFAPAAVTSWPTRALRLESVSVTFDGNNNWGGTSDEVTYTDQLQIPHANGLTNVDNSGYRATYRFRVIGAPQSTVQAVPVAMISSGTQIKHTTSSGGTLNISFAALTVNGSLTKSVTATSSLTTVTCGGTCTVPGGANGTTYTAVPYRLLATTTATTTLTIDEMVDTPGTGTIFKPGSATITDASGRSGVSISDPVYLTSESGLTPRPNHFTGPFYFNSSTSATLNYTLWVPTGTFINTAYAQVGDFQIGATASAKQKVTVAADGSGNASSTVTTQSFSVDAETNAATNVASTTATLNGTVDPNGVSPLTGSFAYGTDPALAGASTITATTPTNGTLDGLTNPTLISVNLTGLSSNTTYYFEALGGGMATGTILSFQTAAIQSPPTVTTNAATNVATTTATLNGTINPNLTPITAIQFLYSTSSILGTATTTLLLDDGAGAALTAQGSSAQTFSTSTLTLTSGTTYYYKIRACTASSGTFPNITCSAFSDGSIQNFTTTSASAPSVTTGAATNVSTSTITFNGAITSTGGSDATQSGFAYSTSSSLTSNVSTSTLGAQSGTASFFATTTGLTSNTTYYFRAYATNGSGTSYGSILSTTTLVGVTAPSVTTNAATGVSTSSITFNGAITSTGGSDATQSGFAYSTSSSLTSGVSTSTLGAQSGTASFFATTTGLTASTTYYFRAYATNGAGTSYGSVLSTTTASAPPSAPSVTTNSPSSVTNASITFNGAITATGGQNATQSGFAYSTDSALITGVSTSTLGAQSGTASFAATSTGLASNTTYYFRAYATNGGGTAYGSILSTTTLSSAIPPSVTTNGASGIATTSLTFNGSITSTGGSDATQSGFAYGTDSSLSVVIATTTLGAQSGTASFFSTSTGLTASTTYYFRAYATNIAGTAYGAILSATTLASTTLPSVLTASPSSVTSSAITFNGAITATGGGNATQSGFAYSTDSALATGVSTSTLGAQTGTASFFATSTGLAANTTYYIRAYATNGAGTAYGSIVSTTTLASVVAPSVSTGSASNVTISSVTFNGSITSTGGSDATQSGFAYSTDSTLASGVSTSTLGAQSGTASFLASSTGLAAGTTYYFRAYATNVAGTSYGLIGATTTLSAIIAPSVTTVGAASVATSSATFNGSITSTGGSDATQSGFAYGTDGTLGTVIATTTLGAQTGTASFAQPVSGLSPSTIYYFRAYAVNTAGTAFGAIGSTTTAPVVVVTAPSVTTSAASGVSASAMTFSGSITSTGGSDATQSGFAYSTDAALNSGVSTSTLGGQTGTAAFAFGASGLSSATTYYFRAYASNAAGTAYGSILSQATDAQSSGGGGGGGGGGGPIVGSIPSPHSTSTSATTTPPSNKVPFVIVPAAKSGGEPNVPSELSPYVCQRYLRSYVLPDTPNNPSEVTKLQQFLNSSEGEKLSVDGIYKAADIAAVKRFQTKYADQILLPWGSAAATGRVYKTTTAKINLLMCARQVGCPYFTKYEKLGTVDTENVKIQDFLNLIFAPTSGYPTAGVPLTKEYTSLTKANVATFQSVYKGIVLVPWNLGTTTGRWYQTSRHAANKLMNCDEGSLTIDNGSTVR